MGKSGTTGAKRGRTVSTDKKVRMKKAFTRAFVVLSGFGFVSVLVVAIVLGLYLKSLQSSLPDPDRLIEWTSDESTVIYDRNGKELFKIYGEQNREFVSIDEYPDHAVWALLAAEDSEFYQHKGLDWKGIVRCGFISVKSYTSGGASGGLCGASTITQQLVRNTIMYEVFGDEAYERSTVYKAARRKLRELLLSMQVEKSLTKDQILQLYMNEVPLGGVTYGYGAATNAYFGKDVEDLTLAESAILAGLIQSPGVYSPLYGTQPDRANGRQQYVFTQLEKYEDLTGIPSEEIEAAKAEEVDYQSANIDIDAYHWVFYVKQLLEDEYGPDLVQRGGLKVTTTLDFSTQKIAEEEVTKGIEQYGHKWGVYNGGMIVIDPNTGQILAMVGSVDPNEREDRRIDGTVNITTSLRQVGSSFKPYVYLTAFQKYGPWLETADMEYDFGPYKPTNWEGEGRYMGMMTAREALVKSRNLPANYTLQLVGMDEVIKNAEKLGVTTLTDRQNYGLSLALGAAEMKLLEHANAYSVFATGGIKRDSVSILKVENSKGEILEEFTENPGERVIDEKDAYLLNWAMCDLGKFGDQVGADIGHYNIGGVRASCGKTGTTNGPTDLVSIQYHQNIVAAVWAGNNNNVLVPGAWSTNVPSPILHSFMERVSSKYPPKSYSRPSGIVEGRVCNDTGRMANDDTDCDKVKTIWVQGRSPKSDERETVSVCKSNDKIASNKEQAKTFDLLVSKTLLNYELENSQQQEVFDKFLSSLKDSVYIASEPGSDVCPLPLGPGGAPVVDLTLESGLKVKVGDTIKLEASARAEDGVDYVEYYYDGDLIENSKKSNSPYTFNFVIPNSSPGTHTISAKVYDTDGRSATSKVNITIETNTSNASVTISSPIQGDTIFALPLTLRALVSNMDADRVNFRILRVGDPSYVKGYVDLNGSDGWSANWVFTNEQNGDYTIEAYAVVGSSQIVNSEKIQIKLNLP
jgi:membrane peptidoglycan carboxypeptidase